VEPVALPFRFRPIYHPHQSASQGYPPQSDTSVHNPDRQASSLYNIPAAPLFPERSAGPEYIAGKFEEGTRLRAQVGHADNPDAAAELKAATEAKFECEWLPDCSISPVLGAHTGRGLVGVAFAPTEAMPTLP